MASIHPRHSACSELKLARFIWKPRKTDEPSDHITTHNYDLTNPETVGTSTLDALLSSLCVQEDPYPEHPFHGLVNAAKASSGLLHNGDIYVSIRSPAKDNREEFSEHETMNNMRDISHFAFVVDTANPNSFPTQKAIEPAVEALARWLEYSSEQADDARWKLGWESSGKILLEVVMEE